MGGASWSCAACHLLTETKNWPFFPNGTVCLASSAIMRCIRIHQLSTALIIHLLFSTKKKWNVCHKKFHWGFSGLSQKKFWARFDWETPWGNTEFRLGASPSVSPLSIQTCQSIHICIDLLSASVHQPRLCSIPHPQTKELFIHLWELLSAMELSSLTCLSFNN